ncbi:hypothetical protein MRB53_035947 [Persea americana]|uniref:Uncharacterized protein n=1 Tax=Persea americana TaxID=3435 RepID=A0ACC2K659_PERAE|nr:hypothetical protein MRB53_035947 [Persea americana]
MSSEASSNAIAPPVFDGTNYQVWAVRMEAYLDANDQWEAVENAYEVPPLPDNPTMAQMKNHKEMRQRKSKAKASLFAAVSSSIFTRVMTLKTAKEIWNFLKKEYEGNERVKGMQVLNLIREFEMQRMKESETIKDYSDRLLDIVNKVRLLGTDFSDSRIVQKILVTVPEKFEATISSIENSKDVSSITLAELLNALQAQEQRRLMRQEGSVEGAFQVTSQNNMCKKEKQSNSNNNSNNTTFPPCPHCKKSNHPQKRCWWRPDIKCHKCGQLGHVERVKRDKLDKKAEPGIFIGYSSVSKAYRIYLPQTNKVIVSRDVQFFESDRWSWENDKKLEFQEENADINDTLEFQEQNDDIDEEPVRGTRSLSDIYQRSGRIVDSFIPTKKSTGLGCGFAFVRFKTLEEVNRAVTDNNGKSWGKRLIEVDRGGGRLPTLCQKSFAAVVASPSALHEEAWAMKDSFSSGVRVAPWASREGKKDLQRALVGFLTSNRNGLQRVDNWLAKTCGLLPVQLALMDDWAIWMLFVSEDEANAALSSAMNNLGSSPFQAIERCMEVVGRPPRPCWVRMKESVFRKLGDCLDRTLEVDKKTIDNESLVFGRVKVMLGGDVQLQTKLSLWFEDLMTSVVVEEDNVSVVFEGVPGCGSSNMKGTSFANSGSVDEEDDDDVRLTYEFSNFKSPSSEDEFNFIFQGRSNKLGLHLDSGYLGNGLDLGFELDHTLTLGWIVNSSPRALFCLERSAPSDFSSYPSSLVAYVLQERGSLIELVDPKLGSEFNKEEAIGMITIALLYTNSSSTLRPTMSAVVSMLEGRTDVQSHISVPNLSSDDLDIKAIRSHHQQIHSQEQNLSQSQSISIDGLHAVSSASAYDLYPINMDSDYWNNRE